MSIKKKTLAQVKRQVFAARSGGEGSEGSPDSGGPTLREQRNMARLAGRQVQTEAARSKEYALKEGDLVTVNGTTSGYVLSNKISPWIALPKGTTGVLVVQDPIDPTGRVAQRKGICHVSFPVGLVEITSAALRNASDTEDSD